MKLKTRSCSLLAEPRLLLSGCPRCWLCRSQPQPAGSEAASSGLPPAPATYQPGDQVWSNSDSVPPPGATIPFVAPDPDALQVILSPIRPYRPGDKVWTSSDQVPAPAEPDANGCQRVPSSGDIGYHVYASTTYEYSNYWY